MAKCLPSLGIFSETLPLLFFVNPSLTAGIFRGSLRAIDDGSVSQAAGEKNKGRVISSGQNQHLQRPKVE